MHRIFLYLIVINFTFSLNFEFNQQNPEIIIDNHELSNGFLGGLNYSITRWVDWDNDGDSDLFLLDEDGRIRYYQNNSILSEIVFSIVDTNFLDINNITWFYIGDFDNDNDFDIVTEYSQNPSYISFYLNDNGEFINMDLLQTENDSYVLGQQGAIPTFCDIDGDNDLDFFAVNLIGTVSFYENVGFNNNKPIFNFITSDWENISIVGQIRHGANAINFIDLDNDNDFDLVWGDYYQPSLYVIWNMGNQNVPEMDNINFSTYFPEENPIITTGRNMPSFTDIDLDGDQDLFVTVLGGTGGVQLNDNFYYYKNIGSEDESNYEFITNNFFDSIDLLSNSSPTLIDIDNDGDLDLFIGQKVSLDTTPFRGRINFFENIGDNKNPIFKLIDNEFLGQDLGSDLCPHFGDIDMDDDYDLIIGTYSGNILIYENIGNKYDFNFIYHSTINTDSNFWFSVPYLYDFDNDGNLDIIAGNIYGNLVLYLQDSLFSFILDVNPIENVNVGYYSAPYFFDFDLDNDMDLVVGGRDNHQIYINENNTFSQTDDINIPYLGKDVKFIGGNLYNSNQFDLIAGISTGGIYILSENLCTQGDLNQDLAININDIIMIVNIILGIEQSNNLLQCSGDLDNNNGLNLYDIISLVNLIM
tara:strand:- start:4393 stop:6318 length:1926 start_codon:yes stop_codon:yes gene_type:complete